MAEKDAEATKTQTGEDGESIKDRKEQIKLESEDPGPGPRNPNPDPAVIRFIADVCITSRNSVERHQPQNI